MNISTNAQAQLDRFNNDMKAKKGRDFITTQGYLRDDFRLSFTAATSYTQIQWTLTQLASGVQAQSQTANRLKTDDAFLVLGVGFFLGFAPNTTTAAPTATQESRMILHSFPDDLVFTADTIALQALYNGYISIKQASTTYFENLECYEFYRVGTAQQTTLLFTASTQLRSTWEGYNYGFVNVPTPFRMAGNKNYTINLNIQQGNSMAIAALTGGAGAAYATIRLMGFLATGCANLI